MNILKVNHQIMKMGSSEKYVNLCTTYQALDKLPTYASDLRHLKIQGVVRLIATMSTGTDGKSGQIYITHTGLF